MAAKRLTFWLAVAGVSVLAQIAVQILADKANHPGLARLVDYEKGNTSG